MRRVAIIAAVLLVTIPAFAQSVSVQVQPASPTTGHFVRLAVTHPSCPPLDRAVRNGSFLDIESDTPPNCITTPPIVTTTLNAGYLPAGTYTIRFVDTSAPPARTITNPNAGTFTVTAGFLEVLPPAPTTADVVRVRVHHPLCPVFVRATRNGSIISLEYTVPEACIGTPPDTTTTLTVGYLPAGTYTLRTVDVTNPGTPVVNNADAGSIVVAESHHGADVPALDATGLTALIAAIAIAAFMAIRRAAL